MVEVPTGAFRQQRMFELTRDGFVFLVMGFTGPKAARWKEAYIAAFNAMEAQLAARTPAPEALLATMAGLMEQMIALQHKTLEVLERLAPKPRTRRTAMADDVRKGKDFATLYYSADIHKGAQSLPPFVAAALAE